MAQRRAVVAAVIAIAVAVVGALPAFAGSTSAEGRRAASAIFAVASGGVDSEVRLQAFELREWTSGAERVRTLSSAIVVQTWCDEATARRTFREVWSPFTPPERFDVASSLSGATLGVELSLSGQQWSVDSCAPGEGVAVGEPIDVGPYALDVAVAWTGTGPILRSHGDSWMKVDGSASRSRDRVRARQATAEADISGLVSGKDIRSEFAALSIGRNSLHSTAATTSISRSWAAAMPGTAASAVERGAWAGWSTAGPRATELAIGTWESRILGRAGGTTLSLTVDLTQSWCENGTYVVRSGTGSAAPSTFEVGRSLRTASVSASVTLAGTEWRYDGCDPIGEELSSTDIAPADLAIDLTWRATASGTAIHVRDTVRWGDQVVTYHGTTRVRTATVVGSVTGWGVSDLGSASSASVYVRTSRATESGSAP